MSTYVKLEEDGSAYFNGNKLYNVPEQDVINQSSVSRILGGNLVSNKPYFIKDLKKNDRIRIEIENITGTNNVTMKEDSFFIVAKV